MANSWVNAVGAVALGVAQTGATEYFVVKLTLETTDPTNPAYQRDSQTMLDGFQVLPPT